MRITNVDTLSALLDRLITENIKLFFFDKEGKQDLVDHQTRVIKELKLRLNEVFNDIFQGDYQYLSEKRTFNEEKFVEELEELIHNDINIGEADRERMAQATSESPDMQVLLENERRLRLSNEGRARNKNQIDDLT